MTKISFPDIDSWAAECARLVGAGLMLDKVQSDAAVDEWMEANQDEWNCTTPDQAADQIIDGARDE